MIGLRPGVQGRITHQISQAHEGSVGGRLLYLNLCLIRTFLQFLCVLHPGVVLEHRFFLELVGATDQGKVVVESVVIEDLVIAFIVGVSIDSSHEARGSTADFGRLIRLGLCLSLHLGHQTGVWNGSVLPNGRSVGGLSVFLFNLRLIIDLILK